MSSVELIRDYISKNIPQWKKTEDVSLPRDCDLFSINSVDKVLLAYTNVNITGTDRAKPQIRVFLKQVRSAFEYAKKKDYKFFLFTIFTQDSSMASGLTAFDPHEFLVSLETNLDNEESRRDLRSLYDFVQNQFNGKNVKDFIRCPQDKHNAGIKQASFIRIKEGNVDKSDTLKKYVEYFDSRPYLNSKAAISVIEGSPSQIIYYGVPGCGKSKKIQDITGNVDEYYKTRIVFHPEYTSADFIGQIFPCVGENGHGIDYRFKAGPFTEILRRAYLNSQKQFYLVIEEINRGNAAAIFSDVFQLLDRLKDGKTDSVGGNTYKNGWSQYFVDNVDVNAYIRKEEVFLNEIDDNNRDAIHLGVEPSSDRDSAGCYKSIKIKDCNGSEINFSANTAIRLPPNLSIYATMNTSDQNVFTLDNAFQRRFDMEMIPNELDTSDADSKVQYETVIGGAAEKSTGVSWGVFRDWINGKISNANTLLSTEDRCLGGWFVTGDSITDKKKFAEKVLKYLWDDAFKHNREIFKLKSLSEIVAKFVETNGSNAFKEIFGEVPEVKDAV